MAGGPDADSGLDLELILVKLRIIAQRRPLPFLVKKIPGALWRAARARIRGRLAWSRPGPVAAAGFDGFTPKCRLPVADRLHYLARLKAWGLDGYPLAEGERIVDHVFNLLGSGDCRLGERIAWNVDFKTGYRWENGYYQRIRLLDPGSPADVKLVWELSRFQHLFTLGKAYWISGDERYAAEFGREIGDWADHNPVEFSVNWTSAMEAAIRAVNWIAAYCFFKDALALDPAFWRRFQQLLYLHGRFIMANLENRARYNNNHYLADLTGLIWLGLYFGDHYIPGERPRNNPKVWLTFAMREFEKQLLIQVNPDGSDYESATAYHRLVTELALLTAILCRKNGLDFSAGFLERLRKMVGFLLQLTKDDGCVPSVGDADDGRLLIFTDYSGWRRQDCRDLLAIAGEFFGDDRLRSYGAPQREAALWATGSWHRPRPRHRPQPLVSRAFPQGGYYLLRNERIYCLIRCGELSCRGEGGHSHNDQLSLVLNVQGLDFIVDPGLYVYSADYRMRNLFRSTGAHNTLCVRGLEQNRFDPGELFAMAEASHGRCLAFQPDYFCGRHYGYRAGAGFVHQRSVSLWRDGIGVSDVLLDGGKAPRRDCDWYLNFTLAPEVLARLDGDEIELARGEVVVRIGGGGVAGGLAEDGDAGLDAEIAQGWVAPGYGVIVPTRRLIIRSPNRERLGLSLRFTASRQLWVGSQSGRQWPAQRGGFA